MLLATIIILVVWAMPLNDPKFGFVPIVVTILAVIYGVLKLVKTIAEIILERNE